MHLGGAVVGIWPQCPCPIRKTRKSLPFKPNPDIFYFLKFECYTSCNYRLIPNRPAYVIELKFLPDHGSSFGNSCFLLESSSANDSVLDEEPLLSYFAGRKSPVSRTGCGV